MSALHYAVTHRKVEALKAMFAVDGPSAKVAASHISITGSRWSPRVNTPLLSAITTRDEELVKALLDSGAKPKITFEEYAKAFIASFDKGNGVYAYHQPITNDVVKSSYTNDFNQPVIYAVQNYLPMTAKLMLEKGCSSNTLYVPLRDEFDFSRFDVRSHYSWFINPRISKEYILISMIGLPRDRKPSMTTHIASTVKVSQYSCNSVKLL